jgi:hypothetical protein
MAGDSNVAIQSRVIAERMNPCTPFVKSLSGARLLRNRDQRRGGGAG